MPCFRETLIHDNLSDNAVEIILCSLAEGTNRQYKTSLNKWLKYCTHHNVDPLNASIIEGIEFLTELFHKENAGYSTINTARSALALILKPFQGLTFGKQTIVQRFMKGIFGKGHHYQDIMSVLMPRKYWFTLDQWTL